MDKLVRAVRRELGMPEGEAPAAMILKQFDNKRTRVVSPAELGHIMTRCYYIQLFPDSEEIELGFAARYPERGLFYYAFWYVYSAIQHARGNDFMLIDPRAQMWIPRFIPNVDSTVLDNWFEQNVAEVFDVLRGVTSFAGNGNPDYGPDPDFEFENKDEDLADRVWRGWNIQIIRMLRKRWPPETLSGVLREKLYP